MHQDQRIGLALGVLLVGACAAFFFRNDNRPVQNSPRLEHARELDEWIAEKSTRPYTKGIETIEKADQRNSIALKDLDAVDPFDPLEPASSPHSWNPMALFQPNSSNVLIGGDQKSPERSTPTSDDVFVDAPSVPSATDEPIASLEVPVAEQLEAESQLIPTDTVELPQRTHVVQKGENLSAIAARVLGDRNRFQEIFDANRDQLVDPNDLKQGMTLRLPGSSGPSLATSSGNRSLADREKRNQSLAGSSTPTDDRSQSMQRIAVVDQDKSVLRESSLKESAAADEANHKAADSLAPTSEPVVPRRFVPARRSPLPPRQSGNPLKPQGTGDNAGRRLSQAPLDSISGKIAR